MPHCRHVARNEPRIVPNRHDTTPGVLHPDDCPGCLPCAEPHCQVCGSTHIAGTCAECLAKTREDLHEIARMVGALSDEVAHRGVDSEAMMLLAPSADPESWQHHAASALVGRTVPADCDATDLDDLKAWLDAADRDRHPMWVLGTWDMLWRATLEHDEPDPGAPFDLTATVDYLDRQLSYMAGFDGLDFAPFATALRECRAHVESVLHDGDRPDRGAPCMRCKANLERRWAVNPGEDDGWVCPTCKQFSTDAQYHLAVANAHRVEADWLTDTDMEIRTGVKAATVRSWARADVGLVRKRRDSGRTLYAVTDVETTARAKGLVA